MARFRVSYRGLLVVALATFHPYEPLSAQTSSVSLSSVAISPGVSVVLSLSLSASGTAPAGLAWTFVYPLSQVTAVSAVAGLAATAAGETLYCDSEPGLLTCLLIGLNGNPMASGVVANLQLTFAPNVETTAIMISSLVGVDTAGNGLNITVGAGGVILVPGISSLTCSPGSLGSGATASCTAALNTAAPAGGSSIALGSNNTLLTVPAFVTVAAGATTAAFSATAAASIASNLSATLTATLGSSSQTASIGLQAPVLVSGIACSPTSLGPSAFSTCTVTLKQHAPAGGSAVTLASDNTLLAVPNSVTVAAGATTATFSATAAASIAGNQNATVIATLGGSSGSAAISLVATSARPLTASPASVTINSVDGGGPSVEAITLTYISPVRGIPIFLTNVNTGHDLNWISVSPSAGLMTQTAYADPFYTYSATVYVSVNPAGFAAGAATTGNIYLFSWGGSVSVPVTMNVTARPPDPSLSVSPLTQNVSLTEGALPATRQVTLSNAGGGTLQFSAQTSPNQGTWLKLTGNGSGGATQSAPASLGFTADPAGLDPGLYSGQITVQDAGSSTQSVVAVSLAINTAPQLVALSQSGLTFSAVAGGLPSPSQSFTISNQGAGLLSWTASAQTISNPVAPSANWLSISLASGSAIGGQTGSPVEVVVNPAGLPAGQYYGSVNIDAPNAANNPQSLLVLLNVAAADDTDTSVGFSTGGVIFSDPAGAAKPQQRQIDLFNPSNTTINYSTTSATSNGSAWLTVSPASGQLLPGSTSVSLAANMSALAPGLQTGTVTFTFDNGAVPVVQVAAIANNVTFGSTSAVRSVIGSRPVTTSSACVGGKPGYLVPVFRQPLSGAILHAALPQTVQLVIADDCGSPLAAINGGAAQISFSNLDGSIDLHDIGGGIWEGTWTPVKSAAQVKLHVVAFERFPGLGSVAAGIAVSVRPSSADAPAQVLTVVNAAIGDRATPWLVTPGGYVAIYGTGLASNGQPIADTLPLPGNLNGTQLFVGGQPLPLVYAGPGEINALIPQNLNPNASYQLIVQRGLTMSVPALLTVAEYQPGIYTLDLSGAGQGAIGIAGTSLLAAPVGNASRPVKGGSEFLSISATGLGPVIGTNGEAPPADGVAAPFAKIYQTTAKVTATIGGVDALVVFSGLTPSLVGKYQVDVQVPASVPAGDSVPLTLTVIDPVTGHSVQSNTVTIAVQ